MSYPLPHVFSFSCNHEFSFTLLPIPSSWAIPYPMFSASHAPMSSHALSYPCHTHNLFLTRWSRLPMYPWDLMLSPTPAISMIRPLPHSFSLLCIHEFSCTLLPIPTSLAIPYPMVLSSYVSMSSAAYLSWNRLASTCNPCMRNMKTIHKNFKIYKTRYNFIFARKN